MANVTSPPRGWNSYDSYSWIISEQEYLQNAELLSQRLLGHGYQYAVVDYLWYRNLKGNQVSRGFDTIDEWGRLLPDPERWPSSSGGKGFTEVANKVHNLGLKFGIHLMAGLSTQAYDSNTPILDTTSGQAYQESGHVWHAKDIGIPDRACKWMTSGFMAINATSGAGTAFLRSIYTLYASWGVDFVKLDCVFGDDLDEDEIIVVAQTLEGLGNNILLSLSPGVSATPKMADGLSSIVDQYRITGDDWDEWPAIVAHFDVIRDFAAAKLIGAAGLHGQSFPDLDMLPFGWLTDPGVNQGPHRSTKLTQDEQRTQMTLWSMAKSPLMYGGDLLKLDDWTYGLITNPTLLNINYLSADNQEFPHITSLTDVKNEGGDVVKVPSTPSLVLTGCTDPKASGWSSEQYNPNLERICYKEKNLEKDQEPFCVYKMGTPTSSSGENSMYKGKYNLVDIKRNQLCLDPYPKRKLKAQEVRKQDPFSPCTRFEPSQRWELKSNGTLFHGHSGKCATVDNVEAQNDGGIRSWIATGTVVETYVAFFNLNDDSTTISAKIDDLASVLPGRNLRGCKATEIWSGTTTTTGDTLSAQVAGHGCALFVISC